MSVTKRIVKLIDVSFRWFDGGGYFTNLAPYVGGDPPQLPMDPYVS